ncbi:LppM family (lipo)protein [Actinokineospora sp. G85]|uniref:LppM family (lipo)protein n=1 Tax=Actinokineospora sp. G85 TaxID=3406626 RepID=UPI003C7179E5
MLALSGCLRVQAAISVSEADLVSGELVVASVAGRQGDLGPELTVPPELRGKVRTEIYTGDDYVGQTVRFQDLTFAEVSLLSDAITTGKQHRLTFRRVGDLVTLAGSVDLTQLPADRADIQLKITFPGTVARTNGEDDDGTVSWSPKPGAVSEFTATAQYSGASGASWTQWVVMVGAAAVGVSLVVLVLALFSHRRTQRALGPPPAGS